MILERLNKLFHATFYLRFIVGFRKHLALNSEKKFRKSIYNVLLRT